MKHQIRSIIFRAACLAAGSLWAAVRPVSEAEQHVWIQHLLPLPHAIAITQAAEVAPGEVGLLINAGAGPVQAQIRDELTALFQESAGHAPTGSAFQIFLGVLDGQGRVGGQAVADAGRLKNCPNSKQAYLIRPVGDAGLVVAALDETGLYYGAQTLRQLLSAGMTPGGVKIPLASVTDWPDMEERGIWNSPRVVPSLSALKLNYLTYVSGHVKSGNAWHRPTVDPGMLDILRRHAMAGRVQMIHHLNYFDRLFGIYKTHPELIGQGAGAVCEGEQYKYAKRDIPVICASQPLWKTIVADMLAALGEQNSPEVSVWLSEFKGQCQCAQCSKSGLTQTQLESKLVVDAWQSIRAEYPEMGLRIFYSQGDATPATAQALSALPPEVKIERVYSIYPPFLEAAQRGQWVLSFSGYNCITTPDDCFRMPERIISPITNGYAAKLKGVLSISGHYYGAGLIPPDYYAEIYGFPLSAVAEWSWNVNGRTPRQFTEAWATRAGYDRPALFADWVEKMTQLKTALDKPRVPGAGLPCTRGYNNQFAKVGESIKNRQPIGLFDTQALARAEAGCQAALALARPLNQPLPLAETSYFTALLKMYASLNALSDCLTGCDLKQPANAAKLQAAWMDYQSAVAEVLTANDRRVELWHGEPAGYVAQLQDEIRDQWLPVQKAMDEAITGILKKGLE